MTGWSDGTSVGICVGLNVGLEVIGWAVGFEKEGNNVGL